MPLPDLSTLSPFGPALARWSLVVLNGWLGAMRFVSGEAETMERLVAQNRLLDAIGLATVLDGAVLADVAGVLQVGVALMLAIGARWRAGIRVGAGAAAVLAALPLTLLLTNPVWIVALGGFPAIGAGQGLIKNLGAVGVALFLLGHHTRRAFLERVGLHTMVAGLLLPLVWIGGMKFTAVEARGIEPLLASSPFFAWMIGAFGVQGASNVIGVTELLTSAGLTCWWFKRSWFRWGAFLTIGTFAATLSFLVTLPGWHASLGFPFLNGAGRFVVKDIALLGAAAILLGESARRDR